MVPAEVIRRKREGHELPDADIDAFLAAYTRGALPDYQMSALLMAIFFRGLSPRELSRWTHAMLHSGEILDLSDIPGPKVDKHSTGGVGDKVSLPLAPLVAACGVRVPMIAGRGLGHTGGTLDKLESIPGFSVRLSTADFRRVVRDVGCAITGQTETLAPTDRKLYALRDVTATVESIPLIASSIMSKKLAEGIDALVLDVKFGAGAFMQEREQARALARTMVGIGQALGTRTVAYLTSMDAPLGRAVGNALEIVESFDVLRGRGPADVVEVTLALGEEMLRLAGIPEPRAKLTEALRSGAALRLFEQMIAAQGGDPTHLPKARRQIEVTASRSGFVGAMQTDEIGRAAMLLGAGRQKVEDRVDPAVGIVMCKRPGDAVRAGEPLAVLHVNDESRFEAARKRLLDAVPVVDAPPALAPLIAERIETA